MNKWNTNKELIKQNIHSCLKINFRNYFASLLIGLCLPVFNHERLCLTSFFIHGFISSGLYILVNFDTVLKNLLNNTGVFRTRNAQIPVNTHIN